jgi:hypothetical protein
MRSGILLQLESLFRRRGSASGSGLGRSTLGQSPDEPRFFLSHFPPRRTSSKPIGPATARRSFCGDALFANAIRSSVTDAAASRRTMNITTGLRSGAASATVAGRPSPSCPCFLFPTRITVCWLAFRRCGDACWNTALGKRRRPRSRIPIGRPIPPPSAAGRAAWTALNRQLPFCAKRLPAWLMGWGAPISPIPRRGHYPG